MALSADVVRKKLLQIDQATARLRSWMPVTLATLETDQKLQWAIERGLQVAAEALFDTGNHILASAFQESVDQYREIPMRLVACLVSILLGAPLSVFPSVGTTRAAAAWIPSPSKTSGIVT